MALDTFEGEWGGYPFSHYDQYGNPIDTNGQVMLGEAKGPIPGGDPSGVGAGGGWYDDTQPSLSDEGADVTTDEPPLTDTTTPGTAEQPPATAPYVPPSYSGGSTTGAENPFGLWSGKFEAPTPTPLPDVPVFRPPTYTPPPAFSYDTPQPVFKDAPAFSYADFVAPSLQEAMNSPGYQFRLGQGTDRLQNAASARGTLNDSGTLKALMDYGQESASQEYANVFGRAADTWGMGYKNAADTYNTNYRTQYVDPYNAAVDTWKTGHDTSLAAYNTNYKTQYEDPYDISYQAAKDVYAPEFASWTTNAANTQHLNDTTNTNAWNDYLLGYQDYQNRRNLGVDFALRS